MTSQLKRCDDGLLLEKSQSLKCPEENDFIQLQMYTKPLEMTEGCQNLRKRPRSVMQESVQSTSKVILNDRSRISDIITQDTKSLVTSAQDSIGNAGGFLPFWNEFTLEESKKWWLPEKTDCVALDPNLWNGSLKKMGHGSWYSVQIFVPTIMKLENSRKTYFQSSQCLWRDIMDYALLPIAKEEKRPPKRFKSSKKEVTKPPAGKVLRIRLFPTQEERMRLRQWIGTARWTYNQCLIAVEKEGVKRNKKDLRARCLNAANFQSKTELKWVLETPYDIRDEAMNDLLKGYASNFAAKRKNFKMKFRSKKDPQSSIAILSKHWGRSRGEFSFLHKMNSAEPLPKQLEYDSRLVINRLGEFYLCIPEPLKIRAENQGPLFSENQEKV